MKNGKLKLKIINGKPVFTKVIDNSKTVSNLQANSPKENIEFEERHIQVQLQKTDKGFRMVVFGIDLGVLTTIQKEEVEAQIKEKLKKGKLKKTYNSSEINVFFLASRQIDTEERIKMTVKVSKCENTVEQEPKKVRADLENGK